MLAYLVTILDHLCKRTSAAVRLLDLNNQGVSGVVPEQNPGMRQASTARALTDGTPWQKFPHHSESHRPCSSLVI